MINLNAIVQAAHDGDGIQSLARQFDIFPDEARKAVESVLPALSMGLQQQMTGGGFAQLLGHLATARNQAAFDSAEAAQSEETVESGTDALTHLFGNENVTQQVAEHAAQHSSLGSDLVQNMLPVIAAMVMGGLFKSIAAKGGLGGIFGQAQAAPAPSPAPQSGGGLGDILGQMTGQRAPADPAPRGGGLGDILGQLAGGRAPQAPAQPQGGGLGDILGQLAGGGRHAPAQPQTAPAQGGGGLGDLLGGLLGGAGGGQGGLGNILGQLAGGAQHAQAGQAGGGGLGDLLGGLLGGGAPGHAGGGGISPSQIHAGLETLGGLFGHGTQVSPGQKSGLDSILGQILGGGRR